MLQTIAQDFQLSTPRTFWLGTSTALTSTIIQPCCATLADVFGRKIALTGSALLLTVGSLMGALAPNYATILAGRTLQGLGSGGISALTDIIVTDLVPLRVRGKWFAFISVPWAIGTTIGPVLSGILTTGGSWVRLQFHSSSSSSSNVNSDGFLESTSSRLPAQPSPVGLHCPQYPALSILCQPSSR